MKTDDPAFSAALAHALRTNCCGNEQWRGRLCSYHQGYEDGFDVGYVKGRADEPDGEPTP